ncbi:MAG: ATP-binding cassette domain-containing protein [Candidatus Kariarchaeaceae archaeon]
MIDIRDVVVIYPGPIGQPEKNLIALNTISLPINKGQIVAIVGDSGSGKTSLLNVISGKLEPQAGLVFVGDHSMFNIPLEARNIFRSKLLFMINQKMNDNLFFELTARENALLSLSTQDNFHTELIDQIFHELEIDYLLDITVHHLSGGEKQLVCCAIALLHDTQILILDEPTSSLDTENKHKIVKKIIKVCNKYNITTIFATHDPEIAQYADKIIGIYYGRFDRIITQKKREYQEQITELMKGNYYEIPVGSKGTIQIPEKIIRLLNIDSIVVLRVENDEIILSKPHEKQNK